MNKQYKVDFETLSKELGILDTDLLDVKVVATRRNVEVSTGKLGRIKGRIDDLGLLGAAVYVEIFTNFWVEVT
jgi:hypothetical protein